MRTNAVRLLVLTGVSIGTALAPAGAAHAGAVYRYSSDDYTNITQGTCLSTTNRVTITMPLRKPIPANYTGLVKPASWRANNGPHSCTNNTNTTIQGATSTQTQFMVWTDASGNIVN